MEELQTKEQNKNSNIIQNNDISLSTDETQNDSQEVQDITTNESIDITADTQNDSQEVQNISTSESIDIKTENANTTNCLALTIQEDHKLVALKNVFFRSIRMSWKVVVSTITLALIKLFS